MIKLILGDCLEKMKSIPDGSVDLTVTSPPYDSLRDYNNTLDDWTETKWQGIIAQLSRVTKQGGVVVWVVNDATVKGSETGTGFRQALFFMSYGFFLHDTMIWQKTGSGCLGSQYCYAQNFEFMFVFSKGKIKTANLICDRENVIKSGVAKVNSGIRSDNSSTTRTIQRKPMGKRTNIWTVQPTQKSEHPAPFPIELADSHVKSWSNFGDVVFEPFMGSGTTGVAAINNGRAFIGVERDKTYFAIAEKRIREAELNSL